jgi:hypothetical protein
LVDGIDSGGPAASASLDPVPGLIVLGMLAAPLAAVLTARRTLADRRVHPAWGALTVVLAALGILVLTGSVRGDVVALGILVAAGGGAVASAWRGRRAPGLIAVGLVVLPAAVIAVGVDLRLQKIGAPAARPQTDAQLRSRYDLGAGRLTLDLSRLRSVGRRRQVDVSVGTGRLVLIVPRHARARPGKWCCYVGHAQRGWDASGSVRVGGRLTVRLYLASGTIEVRHAPF